MEGAVYRHIYENDDGKVLVEEQDFYGYGEGRQANKIEAIIFKARGFVKELLASVGELDR